MQALGQIHLYSKDPEMLAKFLVDFLDSEIPKRPSSDQIELTSPWQNLSWVIEKDLNSTDYSKLNRPLYTFRVEEECALYEIWQRYVFALYRSQGKEIKERAPIERTVKTHGDVAEEVLILNLRDHEKRPWRFIFCRALN